VAERAGASALLISGASLSASRLGLPDLGFAGLSDVVEAGRRIAASVSVPVVCDADTGYGWLPQVWETVRQFEDAGLAGLHLEDQASPKRCGFLEGRPVVTIDEMEAKLEAALAARRDDSFVIIARTDAKDAEGMDGVVERLGRYVAAGADVAFAAEQYSEDEIGTLAAEIDGPLAVVTGIPGQSKPYLSLDELTELGAALALHPFSSLYAATRAMADLHAGLLGRGALAPDEATGSMVDFEGFNELMGLQEWEDRSRAR
jgi:2-methylisocitrate lyase-like PEP mutase family enzyme